VLVRLPDPCARADAVEGGERFGFGVAVRDASAISC